MSEHRELTLTLRFRYDREKADGHNRSLYDDDDDPVIGDGDSLVRDVLAECGIDELLEQWDTLGTRLLEARLNGDPFEYRAPTILQRLRGR